MKPIKSILFLFLMLSLAQVYGQDKSFYTTKSSKAKKAFDAALHFMDNRQGEEAKKELNKAIRADENFIEAHLLLAQLSYDLDEITESINEYRKAIKINPDFEPRAYYGLALSLMSMGNYEEAKENLTTCLQYSTINAKTKELAQEYMNNMDFAIWSIKHPVPFHPVDLGDSVNSKNEEYFPSITADDQTLFFTRQSPRASNSPMIDVIYDEDIYFSQRNNGIWGKAENVGKTINTYRNEGAVCISADGQTMLFVACDREDGLGSCDLYISKKMGNTWVKPVNIGPPINTKYGESQPSISSDGKTIYFMSDRPGGIGGYDIYKSTLQDDGYFGKPVNLGPKINTTKNEGAPFIHSDNQTLYFVSKGHKSMGGYDIFVSRLNEKGEWGEAENLGYPINTFADENSLIVNAAGNLAYFASNRKEGKGGMDIYAFDLYPEARPFKVAYLKGKAFDKESTKPLSVHFELQDIASGKTITEAYSNKVSGEFLVCLPAGKDYALHASKDGYLFYSENFSLKESGNRIDSVNKDVPMQPIKIGERVVLKNIFFETNKYDLKDESKVELATLVAFLNKNSSIHIEISGHTDNVGGKDLNQTLSENRAQSVYRFIISAGIDKARMSFHGYGDTMPIVPNDSDEHRALNRRTEFKIVQ